MNGNKAVLCAARWQQAKTYSLTYCHKRLLTTPVVFTCVQHQWIPCWLSEGCGQCVPLHLPRKAESDPARRCIARHNQQEKCFVIASWFFYYLTCSPFLAEFRSWAFFKWKYFFPSVAGDRFTVCSQQHFGNLVYHKGIYECAMQAWWVHQEESWEKHGNNNHTLHFVWGLTQTRWIL